MDARSPSAPSPEGHAASRENGPRGHPDPQPRPSDATARRADADTDTDADVDLGSRAKVMSGLFGVRRTVSRLPRRLLLMMIEPVVRTREQLGQGVVHYDHDDYRCSTEPGDDASPPSQSTGGTRERSDLEAYFDLCGRDDFSGGGDSRSGDSWDCDAWTGAGRGGGATDGRGGGTHGRSWRRLSPEQLMTDSVVLLHAVDAEGRTATVHAVGVPFRVYVQCPTAWRGATMRERIVEPLQRKLRLPEGAIEMKEERRRHFCGWTPDPRDLSRAQRHAYCRLGLPSVAAMRRAVRILSAADGDLAGLGLQVHESAVAPVQKALDAMDLPCSGWFEVDEGWSLPDRYATHSQIEVAAHWRRIRPRTDVDRIPPVWRCAWDIECYSGDRRSFPSGKNPDDRLICISTVIERHGNRPPHGARERGEPSLIRVCHHVGEVDDPPEDAEGGVVVVRCATELEAIERWRDMIALDLQPSALYGYNTHGFDFRFLAEKARLLTPPGRECGLFRWGPHLGEVLELVEKEMKGYNAVGYLPAPGMVPMDLLQVLKADPTIRLSSYTLSAVCEFVFDKDPSVRKMDVPHERVWSNYDAGPAERAENVAYCVRDSRVLLRLDSQRQCLLNAVSASRTTQTPMSQVLLRGQQIRTWNQIVWECHRMGTVVNQDPQRWQPPAPTDSPEARKAAREAERIGYQGAIVLDPIAGFYDAPVATLDFAGLYPSIMMAHNMCFSTLVRSARAIAALERACPFSVLGTGYEHRFAHDPVGPAPGLGHSAGPAPTPAPAPAPGPSAAPTPAPPATGGRPAAEPRPVPEFKEVRPTADRRHVFVQHERGIIPSILAKLKASRAAVRAQQKKVPRDSDEWAVLEGRQLSIKVSSNSVYGFFGAAGKGILPCVEISESVTCVGREMIMFTRAHAESDVARYSGGRVTSAKVLYGDTDSVMIHFHGLPSGQDGLRLALEVGRLAADYITTLFPRHILLDFEKVYFPYLLIRKKRYAGMMWKNPDKAEMLDAKGIEFKRRDNWMGLRTTYGECLTSLLVDRDPEALKMRLLALLANVAADRLPLEDYVITKSLKSDYSRCTEPPPHVVVRDKIRARKPGTEPKSGNRVPFVITEDRHVTRISPRAEDPEHVRSNADSLHVDRLYYLNSLEVPFCNLLEPCFPHPERLFVRARAAIERERLGVRSIRDYIASQRASPSSDDGSAPRPSGFAGGDADAVVDDGDPDERGAMEALARSVKRRSEDDPYRPKETPAAKKQRREGERKAAARNLQHCLANLVIPRERTASVGGRPRSRVPIPALASGARKRARPVNAAPPLRSQPSPKSRRLECGRERMSVRCGGGGVGKAGPAIVVPPDRMPVARERPSADAAGPFRRGGALFATAFVRKADTPAGVGPENKGTQ